jgi:hypothetical protein
MNNNKFTISESEKNLIQMHIWIKYCVFKGPCHEIFDTRGFFYQTIPSRARIHGLKMLRKLIRIRRDIQDNRLQSSDPAVSMRPRDPI